MFNSFDLSLEITSSSSREGLELWEKIEGFKSPSTDVAISSLSWWARVMDRFLSENSKAA